LCQLLDGDPAALPMVTDIEVLAEDTAQIAAGEEYRAGATITDQDALLAKMGADGTDDRLISDAAKARLPLSTMGFAPAGTEHTGIYRIPQLPDRLIRLIAHSKFVQDDSYFKASL
jgi:hypothetical protein